MPTTTTVPCKTPGLKWCRMHLPCKRFIEPEGLQYTAASTTTASIRVVYTAPAPHAPVPAPPRAAKFLVQPESGYNLRHRPGRARSCEDDHVVVAFPLVLMHPPTDAQQHRYGNRMGSGVGLRGTVFLAGVAIVVVETQRRFPMERASRVESAACYLPRFKCHAMVNVTFVRLRW